MSRWLQEAREDLFEQVQTGEISYDDARDEWLSTLEDRIDVVRDDEMREAL